MRRHAHTTGTVSDGDDLQVAVDLGDGDAHDPPQSRRTFGVLQGDGAVRGPSDEARQPQRPREAQGDSRRAMSFEQSVRPPIMDAKNLADLYDLPTLDWSMIERRLGEEIT